MAYSIEHLKGVIGAEGGLAKSNLFAVQLPGLGSTGNILCKTVTLPGKQLTYAERSIGGYNSKVGTGVMYDDVSMTFHVPNSMKVKEYFESWMGEVWNPETRRAGYFSDYAKTVEIKVLKMSKFDSTFETGLGGFPGSGLLPDVNFGPLNASFASGTLSLDFGQNTVQTIKLKEAYPFTMDAITMSNENAEFMEVTVRFTYSEWESSAGLGGLLAGVGGLGLGL